LSEAAEMRREHRATVMLAGGMVAGLVLVPFLNLLTPLFGIALMVHVHKRLSARALPDRRPGTPPRLELGPGAR
jgi:CysZ protein